MKKISPYIFLCFFFLPLFNQAYAHTDTCGCNTAGVTNVNGLRPFSGFGSSLYAGSFDAGEETFDYQVLELNYNFWITKRLVLQATLPIARVRNDGATEIGLSDMAVQGVYQLGQYHQAKTTLWASLGLEIPTGDEDKNLGSGHFDGLSSFTLQHKLTNKVLLFGSAGFSRGITSGHGHEEEEDHEDEEEEDHAHEGVEGAVIAPHTEMETTYQLGVTYAFTDQVTLTLQSSGQTSLFKDSKGQTSFHTGSSLNIRLTDNFTASAFGFLPIGNNERFTWRTGIRLGFTL